MAIAVLISSRDEVKRLVDIGLGLASRMGEDLVCLCPNSIESTTRSTKSSSEKSSTKNSLSNADEKKDTDIAPLFHVGTDFADKVEERLQIQSHLPGFNQVNFEVCTVDPTIENMGKWLVTHHESDVIGHFEISTLFIPTIHGAGIEKSLHSKEMLFESSQIETVLLSLNHDWKGRLPLNNIAIISHGRKEAVQTIGFAGRIANSRFEEIYEGFGGITQLCAITSLTGREEKSGLSRNSTWKNLRKDESLPLAMLINPADSLTERITASVDNSVRSWFSDYQVSREDRINLSKKLEAGASASPEFLLFMALATGLACIGLIQDSAAVIIGAMLVAPLMVPLLSAGLALLISNRPLFLNAIRSIAIGIGIAFLIGSCFGLFALIVPDALMAGNRLCLTNEMISRSQPNFLDPLIGLAAGLAGGFAIGRDGQIGTVAGVAIAAALVPPIATAGLEMAIVIHTLFLEADLSALIKLFGRNPYDLLASHNLMNQEAKSTEHVHLVIAPLILFLLNACATIIGAYSGLRIVGMHRSSRLRKTAKWVFFVFWGIVIAILVLMILPLVD